MRRRARRSRWVVDPQDLHRADRGSRAPARAARPADGRTEDEGGGAEMAAKRRWLTVSLVSETGRGMQS